MAIIQAFKRFIINPMINYKKQEPCAAHISITIADNGLTEWTSPLQKEIGCFQVPSLYSPDASNWISFQKHSYAIADNPNHIEHTKSLAPKWVFY